MKKIIPFVVSLLVISANLLAQYTLDWMQGAGNYSKISVMSTIDSEDNLIVTGYWQSYQIFTRKYDITGTLLWEVADASGTSGWYEKPNWINTDANNNIFVVGNIYSHTSSTDYPNHIVALKYDASGNLLYRTVIPITVLINSTSSFSCRSVLDDNGNLYIGTAIVGGATLYKLDPAGNLIFTSASTVNAPKNFTSMRMVNHKIAMSTGSGTANVAPVFVYDTLGNVQWTAAAVGYIASDVEIDENNNVYVLSSLPNAASPTSGVDTRITKYNSTGTLLWTHDYDFGGTEFSRRFVYLNQLISVIGYGGSSPGAAYFDWKTFQTDEDGNLLWSAIYDATTFNDEEPYYILAKPTGEVIVTGKGGPSPIPNNPSIIQMPIVEYSNTGVQIWMDTPNIYGGWGLASVFASDQSLYAISSSDMTVYHYDMQTPLPVELLTFTGQQKEDHILLEWHTASEINNRGFYIERSLNGIDFTRLDFIAGKDEQENKYTFEDFTYSSGVNYYRLKQEDEDGSFEYSKLISIKVTGISDQQKVHIWPNPSSGTLSVQLGADSVDPVEIVVYDQIGKAVFNTSFVSEDNTVFTTDMSTTLPASGLYWVYVRRAQREPLVLPFYFQKELR